MACLLFLGQSDSWHLVLSSQEGHCLTKVGLESQPWTAARAQKRLSHANCVPGGYWSCWSFLKFKLWRTSALSWGSGKLQNVGFPPFMGQEPVLIPHQLQCLTFVSPGWVRMWGVCYSGSWDSTGAGNHLSQTCGSKCNFPEAHMFQLGVGQVGLSSSSRVSLWQTHREAAAETLHAMYLTKTAFSLEV